MAAPARGLAPVNGARAATIRQSPMPALTNASCPAPNSPGVGTGCLSPRGSPIRATLHPVGPCSARTTIPPTRAEAATGATGPFLYGGIRSPGYQRSHVVPAGAAAPAARSALEHCALGHQAGLEVAPQREQQLPRQGHHHDPLDPSLQAPDPPHEPGAQRALGLVAQPQPGELHDRRPGARVAGPAEALVAAGSAAPVRARRQADVGGELPPVREAAVEHLVAEHGRDLGTDPLQSRQRRDPGGPPALLAGLRHGGRVALRLERPDLLQPQLEPAQLPVDLGPQPRRPPPPVAGDQPREPLAADRLVAVDALLGA